jgi:hypothetical protein
MPEELPDDLFWDKWQQLEWILWFDAKRQNTKENVFI